MLRSTVRYIILIAVTLAAFAGMVVVTTSFSRDNPLNSAEAEPQRLTTTAVTTRSVAPESVKIVERFSGRLQPLDEFSIAFEVAGRVKALGRNDDGERLDEGMRVRAGQPLAQLDNTQFQAEVAEADAQLDEAKARVEKAEADLARLDEIRDRGSGAITKEQYESGVFAVKEARAKLKMAEAGLQRAQKRLDDSIIYAPDDGVIAKRYVVPGESLNPHEPVFDIVQIDDVLLVVGVPDSDVRRIIEGQPVTIQFVGRNARSERYPDRTGTVRYVPPVADPTSGLFRVEIVIPNPEGELRPGMIGLARITTETVPDAFRIPSSAVVFRTVDGQETATIFTITREKPEEIEGVTLADANAYARQYKLDRWIEQDQDVIFTDLPPTHREVVVRGQFRLVDGRPVRVLTDSESPTDTPERSPSAVVDRG